MFKKYNTSNYYLPVLLITAILIFFVNLDVIYINIMEARNFITAREILDKNNWLLTTLNDLPRYQKPPLPTWLTALSASLFGLDSLTALRLPAAISSLFLMLFFYKLLPKTGISKKQSFLSSLILISSFYIIFAGRNGQWDIFTHAFMMLSIYYLWNFFNNQKSPYRNALLAALFFGFSFMSKGPVSLYALLLPFLVSYGIVYKFKDLKLKWKPLIIFLVIAAIVSSWWYLYVRMADPEAFIKITTKETANWSSYNIRPFYYYWSFVTQSGIWTIPSFVALLYPYLKNKVSNKKAYTFSLLWTLIAVFLLSVIPEKKSRYLLPVLIPMAFNTGFYIEYLFKNFRNLPLKEKAVVHLNHGLIAIIGVAFPIGAYLLLDIQDHVFSYIFSSVLLFGIGVAIFIFLKKNEYPKVFYLTVGFIVAIIVAAFPLSNTFLKNPDFNNIASLNSFAKKENIIVYEYDSFTPELIWEYGKPIPVLTKDSLQMPEEKKFGLLFYERDSVEIKQLQKDYNFMAKQRFDINYVHPSKSGYKDRLIRQFYVLEKKD